jgi:heme oxygenase
MLPELSQTIRRLPSRILQLLPPSSSTVTLQGSKANKKGLSKMLDATLREGSHDMLTFGLGYFKSVASKASYVRFTTAHYHFYDEMEKRLDQDTGVAGRFWSEFPELRRAEKLKADLQFITASDVIAPPSPATSAYCTDIAKAANEASGKRLLGHAYVRYLADLFGGRALGSPTRLALGLPFDHPHFYQWDPKVERDKGGYIERIYEQLNVVGDQMSQQERETVVEEARRAFRHNANIYKEDKGLMIGAAAGAFNIATGWVFHSQMRHRPYCC